MIPGLGAWVLPVVGELISHVPYDVASLPALHPRQTNNSRPPPQKQTIKPHVILSTSLRKKNLKKKSEQKHNIRSLRKPEIKLYLAMKWRWQLKHLLNRLRFFIYK